MSRWLLGSLVLSTICVALLAEEPKQEDPAKKPQGQRLLTGKDAKTAEKMQKHIEELEAADDYNSAIQSAEELVQFRVRLQGNDHYEVKAAKQYVGMLNHIAASEKQMRHLWQKIPTRLRQANELQDNSRFSEAIAIHKEILDIRLKVLGEEHVLIALSYSDIAMNLFRQGKFGEAIPLFRRALDMSRRVLGEDNPVTAVSYENLARNLVALGKPEEATPLYRKAFDIILKVFGEEHLATATICNNLANHLDERGKLAEATPLLQKSLDINRKGLGEDHLVTAISYINLAQNLYERGKSAEASALFQKALEIRLNIFGENNPNMASSYSNMALNLHSQGKFAEAAPLIHKALDIHRKYLGEDHPTTATSYNNLAVNFDAQGKLAEAVPIHQKALEIRLKKYGEGHPATAQSYNNLALNLDKSGKIEEAAPLFQKALEIRLKFLGKDHPQTATSYNNLALNLDARGKAADATPLHEKALEIRHKILGKDHPQTATCYNNMGLNLEAKGKATDATPLFQKAMEINRMVLGENHLNTAESYFNLACNYVIRNDLEAARATLIQGIPAYESSRLIAATGLDRAVLRNLNPRLLLACMMAEHEPLAAWKHLELSQARGLFDQMSSATRLNSEEQRTLKQARQRIAEMQPRIMSLVATGQRSAAGNQELQELLRQRREYEQTASSLEVRNSERAIESCERIQATLSADAAILYWLDFWDDSGTIQEHWACVVRNVGEPKWIRLPGTGEKGNWTNADIQLSRQLRYTVASQSPANEVQILTKKLHNQRLAPLMSLLSDVKTLHIVGTHLMAGIPIEVLTSNFRIDYVPSGSYMARSKSYVSTATNLFALGDPVLPTLATRNTKTSSQDILIKPGLGHDWPELPGTAVELKFLQALFPQNTILTRNDANPQKLAELVKSGKLKDYRYLHFATHGESNSKMAFESSLILHGDDKSVARLTAREILNTWKLDADLVTLSACETAIGKNGCGEGLLSFAQAFLTAGARSVCLSLWKVDDSATALLMDRYYRNLLGKRQGLDKPMLKADALHEAKLWLRNLSTEMAAAQLATINKGVVRGAGAKAIEITPPNPPAEVKLDTARKPFDHPRYWAAFILIGDPN